MSVIFKTDALLKVVCYKNLTSQCLTIFETYEIQTLRGIYESINVQKLP
jgi:hypothetical protein